MISIIKDQMEVNGEQDSSNNTGITATSRSVAVLSSNRALAVLNGDEGNGDTTTENKSIRKLTQNICYQHVWVEIVLLIRGKI